MALRPSLALQSQAGAPPDSLCQGDTYRPPEHRDLVADSSLVQTLHPSPAQEPEPQQAPGPESLHLCWAQDAGPRGMELGGNSPAPTLHGQTAESRLPGRPLGVGSGGAGGRQVLSPHCVPGEHPPVCSAALNPSCAICTKSGGHGVCPVSWAHTEEVQEAQSQNRRHLGSCSGGLVSWPPQDKGLETDV